MRKLTSLLLKAAVSGALLYLTIRLADFGSVKDRLGQIDLRWIALELLLLFWVLIPVAIRWQVILARCGVAANFVTVLRFTIIAQFFNQTLPSSVGGDGIRIWLIGRRGNWRAAAYSVFIDRAIGVVSLALLVVVCLPWSLALVRNTSGRIALIAIGVGCIAASAIFVAMSWERLRVLQRWAMTRHLAALARVALEILRSPRAALWVLALSIVVQLSSALAVWCGTRAIGAEVPLLYAVILVPPVLLITVVPVSIAGWGVREGAMIAAFVYAGLPQSDGLIVSLILGVCYLSLGALGGLLWIATPNRTDHTAASIINSH